ncbi:hypothetical protein jhhlp_002247 [Lomentospora prolificans]|uniref:Casein kinase II beta 2 subunit n=1 Tax=Lomentospora prolificans TaxID=41688 RepID=A0A2N3NDH2_9PEZI|nr:hypothetical protein jhhlp_002247 [Lomentospora prolificans]
MRLLRVALTKTTSSLRTRVANAAKPVQDHVQSFVFTGSSAKRQAIHPIAALRQQRRMTRWYQTNAHNRLVHTVRQVVGRTEGGYSRFPVDRTKLPSSDTSQKLSRFTGRAPFASTLRPNLTGGAIPRTAGGYTLGGGGSRYFSHTPTAPAEVLHNVSAAVRAFWLSGHRARFDGIDKMGYAQYRAVSALEDEATRQFLRCSTAIPGSFIEFHLGPTITALSPLTSTFPFQSAVVNGQRLCTPSRSLGTEGVLDELAVDFARAFKDLSVIFSDIQRISRLGDLPLTMEKPNVLRINFPGIDAGTLERLCDDIGVQRGFIDEDPDFSVSMGVPMALRFPFAPDGQETDKMSSPSMSLRSMDSEDVQEAFMELEDNPWFSDPEGSPRSSFDDYASHDFEGLEGIYRFLQECDKSSPTFASG